MMSSICPELVDSDPAHRSVAVDVLVREQPDEDEEEDEQDDEDEDEDDGDSDGYSE